MQVNRASIYGRLFLLAADFNLFSGFVRLVLSDRN